MLCRRSKSIWNGGSLKCSSSCIEWTQRNDCSTGIDIDSINLFSFFFTTFNHLIFISLSKSRNKFITLSSNDFLFHDVYSSNVHFLSLYFSIIISFQRMANYHHCSTISNSSTTIFFDQCYTSVFSKCTENKKMIWTTRYWLDRLHWISERNFHKLSKIS